MPPKSLFVCLALPIFSKLAQTADLFETDFQKKISLPVF